MAISRIAERGDIKDGAKVRISTDEGERWSDAMVIGRWWCNHHVRLNSKGELTATSGCDCDYGQGELMLLISKDESGSEEVKLDKWVRVLI